MIHRHKNGSVTIKYDDDKNIVWVVSEDPRAASSELRTLLLQDWIKILPRVIIYRRSDDSTVVLLICEEEVGKFIHPGKPRVDEPKKKTLSELVRTS